MNPKQYLTHCKTIIHTTPVGGKGREVYLTYVHSYVFVGPQRFALWASNEEVPGSKPGRTNFGKRSLW